MPAMSDDAALAQVIDQHLAEFDRPGVLSVRPGYRLRGGWLTGERAIVVTVEHKLAPPPPGQALPAEVGGVPVDVRQASDRERLETQDPAAYAAQLRLTPDTGSVPHFADERTPSGARPAAAASAHARLAAAVPKPQLPYTAPLNLALAPIEVDTTIRLSASPDSGWTVLKSFLADTKASLTVGLYDFTSAHVLAAVCEATTGKRFELVLDHPPLNPTADQSDTDTVHGLATALGDDLTQAWALTRTDKLATAWIYPSAYHIKVAVRDGATVWLSSGNWNNSNQPAIDPVTDHADATEARHRDRDWHVVIDSAEIAHLFETYLHNDHAVAAAHNTAAPPAGAPLGPPPLGSTATPAFQRFFPPATVSGRMTIVPVLTPDPGVYVDAIRTLIASATKTLYLQFQYIEPPRQVDATNQAFADLVQAVVERQRAGVDVRIIMSEFETAGYLEQLQAAGLDVVHRVKLQNNVHNKGIVVDGAVVLVSSQNWSADGTLRNRDAGVIIHHAGAAEYFQTIFLHDWAHLARQHARSD